MKLLAISKKSRPCVPECVRDMDSPPKFTVRSLSKREHLKLLSESNITFPKEALTKSKDADIDVSSFITSTDMDVWGMLIKNYDANLAILQLGLIGWEGLKDEMGDEVPYSKENFELLSDEIIADLVREITGGLRAEDEKKSVTQSSSPTGSENKETVVEDGIVGNV